MTRVVTLLVALCLLTSAATGSAQQPSETWSLATRIHIGSRPNAESFKSLHGSKEGCLVQAAEEHRANPDRQYSCARLRWRLVRIESEREMPRDTPVPIPGTGLSGVLKQGGATVTTTAPMGPMMDTLAECKPKERAPILLCQEEPSEIIQFHPR